MVMINMVGKLAVFVPVAEQDCKLFQDKVSAN